MKHFRSALLSCAVIGGLTAHGEGSTLYVDAGRKGHEINPGMYGIFFEEINHSGDGGLYAELLQNRGFEEQTIPGGFSQTGPGKIETPIFSDYLNHLSKQLKWDWDFNGKKMTGWEVAYSGCTLTYDVETPTIPLHEATPNAMRLTIGDSAEGGSVKLINTGYWGIAVEKDAGYDLRFYLNTSDYNGRVKAVIFDSDGKTELASTIFDVEKGGEWKEYKAELKASATVKDARFALVFEGDGTIYADYVSLFPQDTFNHRPNGMRRDIAGMLADLKPKFMRWPGGCIVEGIMLENRVKWKETIGDPMTRPGQYDMWGYRSTWGLGYHEILQFCEDTGMDCMFVGNAGMSCINWGGDFKNPGEELDPFYEDIRDAIEYAIGDPATNEWAAKRAEAGHPEPFPLKFVEIGNENFGRTYDTNYKYIYEKLKAEYPQLTFLNTMGLDHAKEFDVHTDMIDPHWYVAPDYFYNNRTIFDNVVRGNYDIYVGEYATNVNVGQGNMDASLSEAVFMMDMERNSDIVKMASYAPLIENSNARNWTCNLIWQRSGEVFGRASYHVQKLFSENLPTYNIPFRMQSERMAVPYHGRVGLGTWLTGAKFRNMRVTTPEGTPLYTPDFTANREEWTDMQGAWSTDEDNNFVQTNSSSTRCISMMNTLAFRDCVIEVEACKTSGQEGFLIVFGGNDYDWDHYYQFNIGGWNNARVGIEDVTNGGGAVISEQPSFKIENGRWYKLKVVCSNGRVEGYIDDELYCSHDFGDVTAGRISAHAGYDEANGEIVVKVVNAEDTPLPLTLNINATDMASEATKTVLKASSLWDENSFSMPDQIIPVTSTVTLPGETEEMVFDPFSLTILRVKATPAATAMDIPQFTFSSEPRQLTPTAETGWRASLKEAIAEAEMVAFPDVEGYTELVSAIADARSATGESDDALLRNATETLRQALKSYYKLQMIPANELEDVIVNGTFPTDGDNSGWSGNLIVRSHVAEIFNSNFSISQTVEGLEDGYYMVYFQGHYRNGGQEEANKKHADGSEELLARFRLNDMETPVVSSMSEVHDGYWWGAPNSMEESWRIYSENPDHYANYLIAKAEDGKLNIGFHKEKLCDADWFIFGNMHLYRIPTEGSGISSTEADLTGFSPAASIYDMQGRLVGSVAGMRRLSAGIYIISEGGRSIKIRI